jgi:hypothetical protein
LEDFLMQQNRRERERKGWRKEDRQARRLEHSG